MAKGNYGVTTLGSPGGSGNEKYSRIAGEFAKAGYIPAALEHGAGHSGKGVKSISDIASQDTTTSNDIFISFRKKNKK